MNRATRRKRMKEYKKTTSKDHAIAIVNKQYRQELERASEERGMKASISVILYMVAYTINYKLGFGKKRLLRIMHSILDNIDCYRTGHLDHFDFEEIVKICNNLGFYVDSDREKRIEVSGDENK